MESISDKDSSEEESKWYIGKAESLSTSRGMESEVCACVVLQQEEGSCGNVGLNR
jgi:hypothetical protein